MTRIVWLAMLGAIVGMVFFAEAQDGEKRTPLTNAEEMAKLVKDLGSPLATTRDQAQQALRNMPKALPYLRRNVAGKELETKRRMEMIISELSRDRFHSRLQVLANQKADAPLDLETVPKPA